MLGHMLIEQWAVEFSANAPKVHLHLDATTAIFDPRAVSADMIIYGALTGLPDSDLTAKRLLTTPYGLVASPECMARQPPIASPQALVKCDCLGFGTKTMDWRWTLTKGRKTENVRFEPRFSSTQLSALHTAAVRGLGIVALPLPGCEEQLSNGQLVRVLPDWNPPDANIFALFPSRRALSAAASQFLDFITMRLRALDGSTGGSTPALIPLLFLFLLFAFHVLPIERLARDGRRIAGRERLLQFVGQFLIDLGLVSLTFVVVGHSSFSFSISGTAAEQDPIPDG